MKNSIDKEFNFYSLFKFALPTIVMIVFMSLYTIVDGLFVSRFIGTTALSAVNIVYPIYNVIIAIGLMFATGGSAVIAKKMGEGESQAARENFSLIVLVGVMIGLIILVVGIAFIKPLVVLLGANEAILQLCLDYGRTFLFFTPLAILQMLFQCFFVTAGKPELGLVMTIVGGCTNIVLDYIFIVPMQMGIVGAAIATGIGITIPAVFGMVYFTFLRKGTLYFVKPKLDKKVLWDSCFNGSSEMVSNIALAVVTFLYNIIMMKYLGENGVAAITIMLYAQFLLNAVFMGFSMGVSPIISFNYGSQNIIQIKKIFRYCITFIVVSSIISYAVAALSAPLLVQLFVPKNSVVYNITIEKFYIFSINFLFAGINIFTSAIFTAFSNGRVSAIVSFMRTFVFITAGLIILPLIWGIEGVWYAMTIAEFLAMIMCIIYLAVFRKDYHYA